LAISDNVGPDFALLPPRSAPAALAGAGMASMRAVLVQEEASDVPPQILAKKYFRAQLSSGKTSRSKPVGSDCAQREMRNCLLRICSTEEFYRSDGSVGERPVSTFGAVLHYAADIIDSHAMAFAYMERAKSTKDRPGRFGCAEMTHGIECIPGLGGLRYTVPVGALTEVNGMIEREGMHFILFDREPLSEGKEGADASSWGCLSKGNCFGVN